MDRESKEVNNKQCGEQDGGKEGRTKHVQEE